MFSHYELGRKRRTKLTLFAMAEVDLSPAQKDVLRAEVKELGDQIRALKESKSDAELIKEKIARMLEKKKLLGDEGQGKFVLKCPKGTRDYGPKAMAIREKVLGVVTESFKRHGAETIDTPVFELRDVLMGKYGEEGGKLIFDLADQGGELLSLRYDLTVPFARYLAMNKVTNIKRYHIAKVYRRDQPVMTRGRYREFFQCDFDIAGQYDAMVPEAECLRVIDEVMSALELGDFQIKLNHRLMLEGMFSVSGVSDLEFKTVCSSIDKLDKVSWDEVRTELVNEKHINEIVVDKLEKFVRMREQNSSLSNSQLLDRFEKDNETGTHSSVKKAIADIRLLLDYCELYDVAKRIIFEPALARGLDYYTGTIFETVVKEFSTGYRDGDGTNDEVDENSTNVGSVAAGGRYDNLVGMFSQKKQSVPCVGVSFGIERLFSIMEMKAELEKSAVRTTETEVFVASAQKNLLRERMKLCKLLWENNIKAEMAYKANPKMLTQLQYCEERLIPLVAIVGERELQEGIVKIRNVEDRQEQDIPLSRLVEEIHARLAKISRS
uniref:histidine--tRNA ligase n=1 Tax=Parascaris univalens TaxID=6257 RepID=A0A914ZEW8_PARUN